MSLIVFLPKGKLPKKPINQPTVQDVTKSCLCTTTYFDGVLGDSTLGYGRRSRVTIGDRLQDGLSPSVKTDYCHMP
jgi:hypothetical protein